LLNENSRFITETLITWWSRLLCNWCKTVDFLRACKKRTSCHCLWQIELL